MAVHVVFQHALFSCMGKWSWVVKSTSGIHRNSSQTCSGLVRRTVAIGLFGRFFFFLFKNKFSCFFRYKRKTTFINQFIVPNLENMRSFKRIRCKVIKQNIMSTNQSRLRCLSADYLFREASTVFREQSLTYALYISSIYLYTYIYIFFKQIWAILFIILEVLFSKNWRILHG